MGVHTLDTVVFIVGGGPAGLAAGIAIRQKGLRVKVADPTQPPIDKACGEGLMPNTMASLKELGVGLRPGDAIPFRGIRFINEGVAAEGAFTESYGLGIRRTILHKALPEAKFGWTRAECSAAGLSPQMGKTLRCENGLVWTEDSRRKHAMGSASISASRPGPILWNFIGEAIARSWLHPSGRMKYVWW
jgi:hypothetical protein